MLVDCFMGNDEIELAKFRIEYLKDYVDLVIIGESRITLSGKKKPTYFKDWLDKEPEYSGRVIALEIDLNTIQGNWGREYFSRNFLQRYLKLQHSKSLAIFSDLDEIPSTDQVREFKENPSNFHFVTPTFYRKIDFQLSDLEHREWNRGVFIADHSQIEENGGRFQSFPIVDTTNVGAHFSYLGMTPSDLKRKLESFAHQELQNEHIDSPSFLDFCNYYAIDHLGRFGMPDRGLFRLVDEVKFTEIQKAAFEYKKAWASQKSSVPNKYPRLIASAAITIVSKGALGSRGILEVLKRVQNNWARVGLMIPIVFLGAVSILFRKLLNRAKERGQLWDR